VVGWVSGREEDHVVVVAKGHELQTPKPDLHGQRKWTFGVSHSEEWRESDAGTQRSPYLVCQLSLFGPRRALSRRVNLCCMLPNLDGDAKRIYKSLSWFGQRKPYVQGGEYCIFLHRSACVGVTSCERGSRSQVSRRGKMSVA
jgi:hypothetical protein